MKKTNEGIKAGDWVLCRSMMHLLSFSRPMKVISLRGKTMLNCALPNRYGDGSEPKIVNMTSVCGTFPSEESAKLVWGSANEAWEETNKKIRELEKEHGASTLALITSGGGKPI